MNNTNYDYDVWLERKGGSHRRENDIRDEYERDYSRIIHASAFRRLQSKTQVLGLGESDFYRTRLTHSMEVAQIGIGILKFLKKKYGPSSPDENLEISKALPSSSLMGAICLSHDIGHPPFGHGGEVALNICMRNQGGFEGNGQTLRILSKLEKYSESDGLNPTRRLLLGVLKYPANYDSVVNPKFYGKVKSIKWQSLIEEQKPPKCYLNDEQKLVNEWILKPLNRVEKEEFISIASCDGKHSKTQYKGLDTSIMELADDISYGLHDLEDAIALRMITKKDWDDYFATFEENEKVIFTRVLISIDKDLNLNILSQRLFSDKSYQRKQTIGMLVNLMITNTQVVNSGMLHADSPILKWNAKLENNHNKFLKAIFELVKLKVIKNKNVQQLEFKGQKIVIELFEALASNPNRLLPLDAYTKYDNLKNMYSGQTLESKRLRTLCDYISGMTDDYATRLYEKIYHPHKGSVFDRL